MLFISSLNSKFILLLDTLARLGYPAQNKFIFINAYFRNFLKTVLTSYKNGAIIRTILTKPNQTKRGKL